MGVARPAWRLLNGLLDSCALQSDSRGFQGVSWPGLGVACSWDPSSLPVLEMLSSSARDVAVQVPESP